MLNLVAEIGELRADMTKTLLQTENKIGEVLKKQY